MRTEPYTTTAETTDDILQSLHGVTDVESGTLTDKVIEVADEVLNTATSVPVAVQSMVNIMVPGIWAAQGGIEYTYLHIALKATGWKFTWDGSEWVRAANAFEITIPVKSYGKPYSGVGGLNVLNLDDMKRLVASVKGIFAEAALDLPNQHIDAKQRVEQSINATTTIFSFDAED